jgi:hypothetical protein
VVVSHSADVTTVDGFLFLRNRAGSVEIGDEEQAMTSVELSLTGGGEGPA